MNTQTITTNDVQKLNGQDLAAALAATAIPAPDQPTDLEVLLAQLAALKAENQKLSAKAGQATVNRITLRVSAKGALSAYGLGRFPVTLYREQWEKLLAMSEEIQAFIMVNGKTLKVKE